MKDRDNTLGAEEAEAAAPAGAEGAEAAVTAAASNDEVHFDPARVDELLAWLEAIARDHSLLAPFDPETRQRLQIAAGRV